MEHESCKLGTHFNGICKTILQNKCLFTYNMIDWKMFSMGNSGGHAWSSKWLSHWRSAILALIPNIVGWYLTQIHADLQAYEKPKKKKEQKIRNKTYQCNTLPCDVRSPSSILMPEGWTEGFGKLIYWTFNFRVLVGSGVVAFCMTAPHSRFTKLCAMER